MRSRSLIMLAALVSLTSACESDSDVRARYSATLTGAAEMPNPVTSSGGGTFTATLNSSNILTYRITFQNLNAVAIFAHIHGPSTIALTGDILVDFNMPSLGRVLTTGQTSGTATGTVDLNLPITGTVSGDSLIALLNNGNSYVNIHSSAHTAGEIRGQIIRQ